MRKVAAAFLAAPVLGVVYASYLVRRSRVAQVGIGLALSVALGLVGYGVASPADSTARLPTPIVPVASARFTTVLKTDQSPQGPVTLDFSTPMDAASVAAALRVEPPAPVDLTWSADRTRLVISPSSAWTPGSLYTVTVDAAARDAAGVALVAPARAAFVVREATTGRVAVAGSAAGAGSGPATVRPDATFELRFGRPVDVATVRAALRIDPPVAGTIESATGEPTADRVTFVPSTPLAAARSYTLSVDGVVDLDGGVVQVSPLSVRTGSVPAVVRFRPRPGTSDVARDAPVSVRFTAPMDRASTAAAFSVTVNGKAVKGSVRWAEHDTVLVFRPASSFPAGAKVTLTVAAGARSADGVAVKASRPSTFTAVKPAVRTAATRTSTTATTIPKPAGAVTGNWHAVELYYLSLMNCTRTGGWVTSAGKCSSPGGRDVKPLVLDAGISDRVSRPFAKLMAGRNVCSHFADGDPGDRLRRAGYDSYRWAENIGCLSIDPYRSMLETHLFYQSEKSYGGGHYVNLMNPAYDRVGIGVWVSGGRVRLVVDLYHA